MQGKLMALCGVYDTFTWTKHGMMVTRSEVKWKNIYFVGLVGEFQSCK